MLSSFKSDSFKKLEAKWYAKLEKEKFPEIEDTKQADRPLKAWAAFKYNKCDLTVIECNKLYYEEALDLLNIFPFETPTHRKIWELHSLGLSEREIAKKIRKFKKSMIHLIIKQLATHIK